jgi:predicted AAA+ superfamily ATPase
MIEREISSYLKKLAGKYPVVTVTGPRQSGKTTLVKAVFPKKAYVNLESLEEREFAQSDPRAFFSRLPDGAILDEIQRVPDLLSYIQTIVDDSKRNGLFILTGSCQFELMSSITQSLAGRTAMLRLLPFSLSEIGPIMKKLGGIDDILHKGFYPRIIDQNLDPAQAYGDYFETYVERDLRQLIHVRNLSQFQKFVRLCAGRIGQLVNLSSLGNDIGLTHTAVREWLTLLETSYFVFLLEPFHQNIGKRLIKTPKLYFYDVGLAAYLMGIEQASHLHTHPLRGYLFENMIVMEILKYRFNIGLRNNLTFFRDRTGNEVDLLYAAGESILAIEIKAAETVSASLFQGLLSLKNTIRARRLDTAMVYGGNREETRSRVKIVPWCKVQPFLERWK